jgi:hypothetical protein
MPIGSLILIFLPAIAILSIKMLSVSVKGRFELMSLVELLCGDGQKPSGP